MKKFYLLTKTLLVAVLLMVGASNAWADIPTYTWDFTNTTTWTTAKVSTGSAVTYDQNGVASGADGYSGYGVTFNFATDVANGSAGEVKEYYVSNSDKYTILWWNTTSSEVSESVNTVSISVPSGFKVTFTLQCTASRKMGYKIGSNASASTGNSTLEYTNETEDPVTITVWGTNSVNSARRQNGIHRIVLEDYSSGVADYTVKYVSTISAVETEIKSNVVRKGEVDATVTLEGSDKNTITYGGHQYYYVSDNASTSTIKDDNSTVVKVVFAQATFDNGAYYFKNKANGAYFAAGNSWSTHAITNSIGHVVSLSVQSGGSYYFDTQISNGGANHYLNGVWTDGAAQGWTIASDGAGYYTISNGSGSNLTAGAVGEDLTVGAGTGDAAKWTVLTAAEWKAENVARLDAATASNGVDATFYIPAANFNRNDNTENAKWQGSPTLNGLSTNYNAEKHNTNFDVYQTLTGLKPGAYKLTVQGFYRNGDAVDADPTVCNAILYANSTEKALVNVVSEGKAEADTDRGFTTLKSGKYVPDGQEDASKTFDNNYYNNELFFVVDEDGALRVGVKKSTAVTNDWTVFDNFKLTYYGTSVSGTITPAGWCSFASSYPLDLSKISGGTVYYASAADGSTITLTSTGDVTVPAGEGLMIKGTPNAEFTINVAASGTFISGNKLIGQTTTGNVTASGTDGKYHYVFGYESSSVYGFYNLTEDTSVSAGKAYLETTTALSAGLGARAIGFVVDDDILTGIEQIENGEVKSSLPVKRIVNGKLVIEKKGMMFNAAGAKLY